MREIKYKKSEIESLTELTINDLEKMGINQKTYDQKEHFFSQIGKLLYRIDEFYGTNLFDKFQAALLDSLKN